jgi:transcriptional regulator of acetoin/glycerol metabolism
VLTEDDFAFLARAGNGHSWTPPDATLEEIEKLMIEAALERKSGNVKEAAVALGIDRSTLYEKIKRYEIRR